jgi:hypothetical protein
MKKINKKQTFKCCMYQSSYFGSSNKISNVKKKPESQRMFAK